MKLSFIVEFQLVPFAFSLILGDLFMTSPPSPKVWGRGTFFQEKLFMGEQIFFGGANLWGGIVLHGRTTDQIMPRGEEFHKMHFPVI